MTKPARSITQGRLTVLDSEIVPIATVIDLDDLPVDDTHDFAAAQFFTDATGTVVATPTAGDIDFTIQTYNAEPMYESPPGMRISLAPATPPTPKTVTFGGNILKVRATPSVTIPIVGAAFWRIRVTCNER